MSSQGQKLKRAIWAEGMSIQAAATALGISRQNLYYYLNSAELPDKFLQNVKENLQIDFDRIFENETIPIGRPSKKTSNTDVENTLSVPSPSKTEVLYMARLLQIPLDELLKLQSQETDQEKLKLIIEVVSMKEKVNLLEGQLSDKMEIIRLLKERYESELNKNK